MPAAGFAPCGECCASLLMHICLHVQLYICTASLTRNPRQAIRYELASWQLKMEKLPRYLTEEEALDQYEHGAQDQLYKSGAGT